MLQAGVRRCTVGGHKSCRLTAASNHKPCLLHRLATRHTSRLHLAHMFPRDAEFATAQLQGILAELRADPALAPLLDDSKVAAAVKEIAANPAALQKHASNPKVMRVMERLLGQELAANEAAAFAEACTTPTQVLTAVTADAELAQLLNNPIVRTALSQIRANPSSGLARWESEPLVSRALDLLEQVLVGGNGGLGQLVDVVAEEVKQKQQVQQNQQGTPPVREQQEADSMVLHTAVEGR